MFVPSQYLDEEVEQNIIKDKTSYGNHEIAEQLNPSFKIRALKHDIHTQIKSDWKRDAEGHKEGSILGFQCIKAKIENLFVQNIIVEHVVKKNIEQSISATTSSIMIGLQGHKFPEKRIKNIQHRKDHDPYFIMHPPHEGAKLTAIVKDFIQIPLTKVNGL